MIFASTLLLLAFAALAAIDGVWVHLWKLRLHARPASYAEHLWHTASAVVFAPLVAALFLVPSGGVLLWSGIALLVAVHVLEAFDMRAETASRADLGGLSRSEFAVHVAAVVTRTGAVALALAARPLEAWSLHAPAVSGAHPPLVATVMIGLLAGSVVVALLHVVLAVRHAPVSCCPALSGPSFIEPRRLRCR